MSDQEMNGASEEAKNESPSDELTLKRHGKEIRVPTQKAVDLAQKGLDYEAKMAEIKSQQQALQSDGERYKEYAALRDLMDTNPQLAKAIRASIEDPDRVVSSMERTNDNRGTFDEFDYDQPRGQTDPHVGQLQRQVELMQKQLQDRSDRDHAADVEKAVDSELAAYPWLEGKAAEIAKRTVINQLSTNPSQSISALAGIAADELRSVIEDKKQSQVEAQRRKQDLKSVPQQRGVPLPTPPQKLDKSSFQNGSMMKALKESARAFGLDV